MPGPETTVWKFYVLESEEDDIAKYTFGPCDESVVRAFSAQHGRFMSDETGKANVLFKQMWGEIDRLRARVAELERDLEEGAAHEQ